MREDENRNGPKKFNNTPNYFTPNYASLTKHHIHMDDDRRNNCILLWIWDFYARKANAHLPGFIWT